MDVLPRFGDGVPGERRIASYDDDRLVLTDRRILHRGTGLLHASAQMILLEHVTSASLRHRLVFRPWLFLVPAGFMLGTILVLNSGHAGPYYDAIASTGLLATLLTLLLPFVFPGVVLRIVTPGDALRLHVPRQRVEEARAFLHHIGDARVQGGRDASAAEVGTSRPFHP